MKRTKRTAVLFSSFLFLVGGIVPTSSAVETKSLFRGEGFGRSIDLAMPLLRSLPAVGQNFKDTTIGFASTAFASDPKVNGIAIGSCLQQLPMGVSLPSLPVELPCMKEAMETSSAPEGNAGDGLDTCAGTLKFGIVEMITSCANSLSKIEAAKPMSLNKAGVAEVNLTPTDLGGLLGLNTDQARAQLVDTVSGVMGGALGTVKGLAPVAPLDLKQAVEGALNQIKGAAKLATIKGGLASSDVVNQGPVSTLTSQAAGAKIGLLGLTNALEDGLLIIDVSAAKAVATWDEAAGIAEASATPALATMKVKDLLNLVPGDYVSVPVDASALNGLLAPLSQTILDSSLEVAQATAPQKGNNVVASTTGVGLHLLKGIGESAAGAKDGGLRLRVAGAEVKMAGEMGQAAAPPEFAPTLPRTGGLTYAFLAGAAMLAAAAPLVAALGRRIRKTA